MLTPEHCLPRNCYPHLDSLARGEASCASLHCHCHIKAEGRTAASPPCITPSLRTSNRQRETSIAKVLSNILRITFPQTSPARFRTSLARSANSSLRTQRALAYTSLPSISTTKMAANDRFDKEAAEWDNNPFTVKSSRFALSALLENVPQLQAAATESGEKSEFRSFVFQRISF